MTGYNTQIGCGLYKLQLETDNKEAYLAVQDVARKYVDAEQNKEVVAKMETTTSSGWISVKDRLPPQHGKKVLVANGHGYVTILALWKKEYGNKWTWLDEEGHFKQTNDITHWMPLPEPPKEEHK